MSRIHDLSGPEKAAILLLSLDEDRAAAVMSHLAADELSAVSTEIASLKVVENDTMEKVVEIFGEVRNQDTDLTRGGVDRVSTILEKAVGSDDAKTILDSLSQTDLQRPFSWLDALEPSEIAELLATEHPQTSAIVLSFLDAGLAAKTLANLPEELQRDLGLRITKLEEPSPDLVSLLESGLKERLGPEPEGRQYGIGGVDALVDLLNRSSRDTEKVVMDALSEADEELAAEVRKRLFIFEDITQLDDRTFQQVLRHVDAKDLPMALKGVSPEVQRKITDNLSERATENLLEEIELLGPVRAADVEAAQAIVVAVINQLEESGEIMISKGDDALID